LTVAEQLRDEEHSDVAFVGAPDSLEARLASEAGIDFIAVRAKGFDRSRPTTFISAAITTAVSLFGCMRLIATWRPDVVIGFGGYVSLPLGLAAAMSGVPLVLHEQNAVPGLANRVLSRWARVVCVTYPASISRLRHPRRAVVTGNPVRPQVASASRDAGRKALGIRKADRVLLVFGGSRGARHINEAVLELYERLKEIAKLKVVHIAGPCEVEAVTARLAEVAKGEASWWQVHDYIPDIGDALAASDLVVCRAGATTLAELAMLGRPAVLVPYPFATEDHQARNAEALVEAGAASLIVDSYLDEPGFGDEVVSLLKKPAVLKRMGEAAASLARPLAAYAIVEAALEQGAIYSASRRSAADETAASGDHDPRAAS
jgi:UDP-N-acetylglucosamine--N-acetylmuramyl-(pentapeptide) pyrophosphoryl-undecaprenol N-acetylglucosamine transferase